MKKEIKKFKQEKKGRPKRKRKNEKRTGRYKKWDWKNWKKQKAPNVIAQDCPINTDNKNFLKEEMKQIMNKGMNIDVKLVEVI